MGHESNEGRRTSHEERVKRQLHILYARQLEENQIFMHELKEYRRKKEKSMLHSIREAIGPAWYQALSVPQRIALDSLESSIYKDLLEGRPTRTAKIMRTLGLYPRPSRDDLMVCIERGRDDPKEMLAQLYYLTFGYPIEGKRTSYILNARLMLSAIFYLGLENLIYLLRERFRPDETVEERPQKSKAKPEPPLASPYLQKMVAVLYEKPVHKRQPPPPLPNLEELDDPYEEEPLMLKPPPPPPPPPPPKKRIPISVCDAMAGIFPLNLEPPEQPADNLAYRKTLRSGLRKSRSSKGSIESKKKVYGLNLGFRKKFVRRKKPVAPTTGLENAQYTICGVYEIHGKAKFILGNVSILPAQGEFIHGGYTYVGNMCVPLHCGYRGRPPAPKLPACDCLKRWQDAALEYVKQTKCYCGHNFDLYNEVNKFPPVEMPYFVKPSMHSPMHFNYHTIFDLDDKQLHVEKEFTKAWEADSLLRVDDGTLVVKEEKEKKKKKKRSSDTCLGPNPKPEDYLKCALRFMRRVNIAARLPDLHLVPELKAWMRRRLYGPLTTEEKAELLRKSTTYWRFFSTLAVKGFGHIAPPKESQYEGHTNWLQKKKLCDNFRRYIHKYRLSVYRSHAYVTNLLWRSMYQAELPDKKFREIFFSYLFDKLEDLQLLKPYSVRETNERKVAISKRRYICLPDGIDAVNF